MLNPYSLDRYFDKIFDIDYSNYASNSYYESFNDKEVLIEVAMPGISKEDLKVSIVDSTLTVEATPKTKSKFAKAVKQSWKLSKDIDLENINANLSNGLLILTLPRVKPVKKTISIEVS